MAGLKYDPLGEFLRATVDDEVNLSWSQLEKLVGKLPPEAMTLQFWANVKNHHLTRRRQWMDNGFSAKLHQGERVVRFTRQKEDRSGEKWSSEELRACVVAYFELLGMERRGEEANKTEVRRRVREFELSGRNDGAYEFRMQNISSVLIDLGLETLDGYKPLRNIGSAKETLIFLINEVWGREGQRESPTADPEAFEARVSSARSKESSNRKVPPTGTKNVERVSSTSARFVRDPEVTAWVLDTADGACEVCVTNAPFAREDGRPFLEVHHVRPLAEGGPDTIANAIAACPNCHRELHHGKDRKKLARSVIERVSRLQRFPKK
jgi:5-methylcytosine-specific restriction protein A